MVETTASNNRAQQNFKERHNGSTRLGRHL
jgi:hypothetical protein